MMMLASEDNTNIEENQNLTQRLKADVVRHAVGKPEVGHDEVLDQLLSQVGPVDFRKLAETEELKRHHFLVLAAEKVLEIAKKNRWDFCRREGFFYLYNGAFWKPIDKGDLKFFLRQSAERMGIDRLTARYVDFSTKLFEQFDELAYLPAPAPDRSTIRINLLNGTFEISTARQQLRAPSATDFLTHQLPFAYDESATAPRFQAFLERVLPDQDCQNVLAEYLGYLFISPAKLKLEKTLLLYGSGANGKSVLFEIVTALLGPENVSHYSLQSLTTEPAYCRAHLATKLVNYASEINGKLEADAFKQMVSGEPIEARLPYGLPFILTSYAKLIFNCNELPTAVEHTPAFFRRFLILPFSITIPEQEQDKELARKIIDAELSGVFNWVLAGLRRLLQQNRFTDPEAARQQLELYKRQSDTVRQFVDEEQYQASTDSYTPLKDMYREYKSFCIEDGYRAVNGRNFKKRLESIGLIVLKRNIGQVVFVVRTVGNL